MADDGELIDFYPYRNRFVVLVTLLGLPVVMRLPARMRTA